MVELVVTMAIILTVCAIAIPNLQAAINAAKIAKAVGDIHAIGDDTLGYNLTNYAFPILSLTSAMEPTTIPGVTPISI